MNYVTEGYEPQNVLKIFEELCAIPHGSGNESGIADYIENFAKERGLFSFRDEIGNVFVRKNATEGYENTPAILLQGHMDMVCEKNADSNHNFLTDGLKLSVRDGFLWADGTTLGGDDGIAVAMMLALLDTDEHPMLECLFTVEEETGLAGANGFDASIVTAKQMINLDSEEEPQITAGCAGGIRTDVTVELDRAGAEDGDICAKISITGLAGGHSGVDINSGKSNANVLMARLLAAIYEKTPFGLISLSGGGQDNAIARECFAEISIGDIERLTLDVLGEAGEIKKELCKDDGGFTVRIDSVAAASSPASRKQTKKILCFLINARTGVLKMSNDIEGLVEFSRNLGVITTAGDVIEFNFSARSSLEAQLDHAVREFDALTALAGFSCRHYARYPGWEYRPISPLRERYIAIYEKLYGKKLSVGVIHAGLECGILSSRMPDLDIISIGPDLFDIHSPDEHLSLASCERFWRALLTLIKEK